MIHHIRGPVLGQYRRDIDPACSDDEQAEAAIREALRYAKPVDEERRDGKERRRAPERSGAPWSRMYLLIAPDTGDVVGVMRASPRAGRKDPPGIVRRPVGRPPKPAAEVASEHLVARATPTQKAHVEALAAEHDMALGEWILERASTTGPTRKATTPTRG